MNKIQLIFIALFIITSCAHNVPKVDFETVNINVDTTVGSPDIDPDSKVGEYGPMGVTQEGSKKDAKSLAIIFGPGLYGSLNGLEVLSCLKRSEVDFQVVGGLGFSSVVVSMFSMGLSIEKIKWLVSNYENSHKHLPYSKPWLEGWHRFIKKNISVKKIKLSDISLWLPSSEKVVKFESKYDLLKTIRRNINISDRDFILKKRIDYQEAVGNIPVDRVLVLNFLNENTQMNSLSEVAKGLMRKALSYVPTQETNRFLIYNLGIINIDDMSSVQINDFNKVCDQIKSKIE